MENNNLVILNESKNNSLDFELDIEGLDTTNIQVDYVIETKNYDMSFKCNKKKDKTWSVTIPPLQHIEKTAYNYYISVIAEGYYFKPLSGVVNIEKTHQIYASAPKLEVSGIKEDNKPTEVKGNKVDKKPIVKPQEKSKNPSDMIVEQIIKEFKEKETKVPSIQTRKVEKSPIIKKEENKPIVEDKKVEKSPDAIKKEENKPIVEDKKVEKSPDAIKKEEKIKRITEEMKKDKTSSPSNQEKKKVLFKKKTV